MTKDEFIKDLHISVGVQASTPKEKKPQQRTTPQYSINIPKDVVLSLGLKKGHRARFYVDLRTKEGLIKFDKKKNG